MELPSYSFLLLAFFFYINFFASDNQHHHHHHRHHYNHNVACVQRKSNILFQIFLHIRISLFLFYSFWFFSPFATFLWRVSCYFFKISLQLCRYICIFGIATHKNFEVGLLRSLARRLNN